MVLRDTGLKGMGAHATAIIDAAANVLFVAVVLFVGAYYVVQWRTASRAEARRPQQAVEVYKPGDRLEPVAGLPTGHSGRTLIVAVKSTCRFCTASMPLYRELMSSRPPESRIVAIGVEASESFEGYLRQHGFAPDAAIISSTWRHIRMTPTLILIGREGTVEKVWEGQLTPAQHGEVLAALSSKVSN